MEDAMVNFIKIDEKLINLDKVRMFRYEEDDGITEILFEDDDMVDYQDERSCFVLAGDRIDEIYRLIEVIDVSK
jgi:hypothetical protein